MFKKLIKERVRVCGNRFVTVWYSMSGDFVGIHWRGHELSMCLYRGQWITNNCRYHYELDGGIVKGEFGDVLRAAVAWLSEKFGYTVNTKTFMYASEEIAQECLRRSGD